MNRPWRTAGGNSLLLLLTFSACIARKPFEITAFCKAGYCGFFLVSHSGLEARIKPQFLGLNELQSCGLKELGLKCHVMNEPKRVHGLNQRGKVFGQRG